MEQRGAAAVDTPMIIDLTAWVGSWPTLIVRGEVVQVRDSLRHCGVNRICVSPLNAAWSLNPHLHNAAVYALGERYDDILPTPVIDPTLPTWREAMERAERTPQTRMVRIIPGYGGYSMEHIDSFCEAVSEAGLILAIQVRMDDPRRQHSLAQVPDVPAIEVAALARRHPSLRVVLAGASTGAIRTLANDLLSLPHFFADVSQADGLDAVRTLVDLGLLPKLLFGSHAPLFIPHSAIVRILNDLDDAEVSVLLGKNAERLLGL